MPQKQQYGSPIERVVRKMIKRKMKVEHFATHEGKIIYNVNGYSLTTEQILELDAKGELTSWGITEFAKRNLYRPTMT